MIIYTHIFHIINLKNNNVNNLFKATELVKEEVHPTAEHTSSEIFNGIAPLSSLSLLIKDFYN